MKSILTACNCSYSLLPIIRSDKFFCLIFKGSLPGVPGRLGPRPPTFPRPRFDLIGPTPDLNPDPSLLPQRPLGGRYTGSRNPFSGFGPRFL